MMEGLTKAEVRERLEAEATLAAALGVEAGAIMTLNWMLELIAKHQQALGPYDDGRALVSLRTAVQDKIREVQNGEAPH